MSRTLEKSVRFMLLKADFEIVSKSAFLIHSIEDLNQF